MRRQSSEQLLEFIFSARSKWFPVAIVDHGRNLVISLWPGDKATINGVAAKRLTPLQKIPSAKIRSKSYRLDFLGSRRHPHNWLSSKGPNYQRGVLLISAGLVQLKDILKEKRRGKFTKGVFFLARQSPGSSGTCNPEETGLPGLPVSWLPILFSGSGPIGLPPVPWTEKPIDRSPCFVRRGSNCCRVDLVGRTIFWFFLSGLQKLEQRAKKCIELRGECVWSL